MLASIVATQRRLISKFINHALGVLLSEYRLWDQLLLSMPSHQCWSTSSCPDPDLEISIFEIRVSNRRFLSVHARWFICEFRDRCDYQSSFQEWTRTISRGTKSDDIFDRWKVYRCSVSISKSVNVYNHTCQQKCQSTRKSWGCSLLEMYPTEFTAHRLRLYMR